MRGDVVLTWGARTPIGALGGALAGVSAAALGSASIRAALERAEVGADQVNEVIFGNVISAGLGQNIARQCALGAGLDVSVPATSVNKVCGSGLKAVMLAAQAIQCGDAELVVAGGTESMSRAPYLLEKARGGYRLGDGVLVDAMIRDGLWDVYNNIHMGACGDQCAARYHISRQRQDEYAIASYQRALAAADGTFAAEIVPVEAPSGKSTLRVDADEQPRRFNEEKLRQLPPVFSKEGTITAANASGINDGAAAIIVMSADKAAALEIAPAARILGYATAAGQPQWFTTAPIAAITRLLDQLSMEIKDIDLFEINEAFAVVPLVAMDELGIDHDKLNIHGGAVALGHPIGASGARTLVTLLNAMRSTGARTGINTLCLGGGEAVAMAVERL